MADMTLEEQVADLKAQVEEAAKRSADYDEVLMNIQKALFGLEQTLKQLMLGSLSSQIMEESITRYLAGYEVGDYTTEVEMAQNDAAKSPSDFKMLVKDVNFNQERFNGIAKEVAQVIISLKTQAMKTRQDAESKPVIMGLDGRPLDSTKKPTLHIVKP